jgi:hypothetical protein
MERSDKTPFILALILLTSTKWGAPASASKWRMGFNLAFKGLMKLSVQLHSSVYIRRKLLRIYRTEGGMGLKFGLDTVEEKVPVSIVNRKPVVQSEPIQFNN